MRKIGFWIACLAFALPACRRSPDETQRIQDAAAIPIVGAFGKQLGERWPDLPAGATPRSRDDLFIFAFTPENPLPELKVYLAWVRPNTMQICRLTAAGEMTDDKAFAEFFQRVESRFGHLAPHRPAESFQAPKNRIWSSSRDGRTVLLVRRDNGRTTLDLFDVFLGSRTLEEILSAKGAHTFDY